MRCSLRHVAHAVLTVSTLAHVSSLLLSTHMSGVIQEHSDEDSSVGIARSKAHAHRRVSQGLTNWPEDNDIMSEPSPLLHPIPTRTDFAVCCVVCVFDIQDTRASAFDCTCSLHAAYILGKTLSGLLSHIRDF